MCYLTSHAFPPAHGPRNVPHFQAFSTERFHRTVQERCLFYTLHKMSHNTFASPAEHRVGLRESYQEGVHEQGHTKPASSFMVGHHQGSLDKFGLGWLVERIYALPSNYGSSGFWPSFRRILSTLQIRKTTIFRATLSLTCVAP